MMDSPSPPAADALTGFETIVGPEFVRRRGEDGFADRYADPFAFDLEHASAPIGAILPANVPEVQEVVRAAARAGLSLWPISRGRNLGYGGASPADAGTVVLDLGRLDRIVDVDVESAYAVVEPGVSFFDLAEALQLRGAALWPSVPDLGGGSVLGNALERGFGYTSHGQHSQYLCGYEVVLPDGELLRTGMGAAGSEMAHRYKGGFGPSLDGLFHQSNLGIVVRVGIWLMPAPESVAACLITAADSEGLEQLVDLIRPLQLDGTIDGVVIVGNALAIASQLMPRAAVYDGDEAIPDQAIRAVATRLGLGWWNAKFGLYGRLEVVEAQIRVIERTVAALPGMQLTIRRYTSPIDHSAVHPGDRAQLGIPSSDLIQMAAWRGGTPAHTDFSLVAPTNGAAARKLVQQVRGIVERNGLDHVGGFTMFGRHAVMLTLLAFDADDASDRALISNVFSELLEELAESGHVPYRAHPAFMDRIAELYGFGDGVHRRTIQRIKAALDPKGILAPGKQGIWPLSAAHPSEGE